MRLLSALVTVEILVVGGIVSQTDQISSESAAAATKLQGWLQGEGRAFGNNEDVMLALEAGELETLSPIRLR